MKKNHAPYVDSKTIKEFDQNVITPFIDWAADHAPDNQYESKEAYKKRLNFKIHHSLEGYLEIINHAATVLKTEGFKFDSKNLKPLELLMNDREVLKTRLEKGETLQNVLQIHSDDLLKMYDVVLALFERHSYKECLDVLVFLTQLSPTVDCFWVAFATCCEKLEKTQEASWGWIIAAELSEESVESYFHAARLLKILHKTQEAEHVLKRALTRIQESQKFANQENRAKELLVSLK